jgi:hypothetical protein
MHMLVRLGLAALTLLLAAGPAAAAPAAAPAPPHGPVALPPVHFSVDTLVDVTPARAHAMKLAGVQLVRIGLPWSEIQPTAESAYDWTGADARLNTLAAEGLGVLLTINSNPAWAASYFNGPVDRAPEQVYFDFVTAAAARYSQAPYTVKMWEIYNEPDEVAAWGNRAPHYAQVMQEDYQIIHGVMPNAAVVMGGLAYDNFTESGGPFVRQFLADFLAVGGGPFTDAINFHHYSGTSWPNLAAVVTSLRDTASAAGIQRPLIWTESGAPSSQRYGGSPSMQAGYVVQAYAAAFGLGVGMMTWFPFQDFDNPTYFYFASHGLLGLDGTTKPSYAAYSVAASYLTAATALRAQDPGEFSGPGQAEGYTFAQPDGGGLVVAWTNSLTATESWPASHVRAVLDIYGQPAAYSVVEGQAVIPLGSEPRYIELDTPSRFRDVPLDFWGQPFIELLSARGAVGGYADSTFRPGLNATRGQISKMVVLAMGWPIDTSRGQVFSDVPPQDTYYTFVSTAYAHGIISGYADGTFRPQASVSRGQLSKMLTIARGWPAVDPASGAHDFDDVAATHPFYGFIEAVFQHGVVSGYADRTFRPGNTVTRAQLAKMIGIAVTSP